MKKNLIRKKALDNLFFKSLEIYNLMNKIASMIGPKNISRCIKLNKELKNLIEYVNQNSYLINNLIIKERIESLMDLATEFNTRVKHYNPVAKDDMENRLYLVFLCQYYGKDIIDMYEQDQFPYYIYENFNFRQDGRIIVDQKTNYYEKNNN